MNLLVGRFQPFHKGHEALLRQALADGPTTVGIGSSQESRTERNPFTAEERKRMIHAVFPTVEVVEIPDIHDPPNWVAHVQSILAFHKAYGNDAATLQLFADEGTEVVSPGLELRSEWEGSRIRQWKNWQTAVPSAVVPIIEELLPQL